MEKRKLKKESAKNNYETFQELYNIFTFMSFEA